MSVRQLTLGGFAIEPQLEPLHWLLAGTTGTGKTTAIEEMLTGIVARGDCAIVCDPQGSYPCRSHYVIRDSRVLEAKAMTERQIQRVKANDRADKTAQIRHTNHAKEDAALNVQITPTHEWQSSLNWLQHLIRWLKSL